MRAGKILRLAGNNYIQGLAAQYREVATTQLNKILETADTFNANHSAVDDDAELSPEGRVAESRRVAAAALAKLASVDVTVETLTERAVSLEATLLKKATPAAPKDVAERIAYELRLQEIRDQLRELPASERLNTYRATTDPMMLAAMEDAPMTLSQKRPDGSRRMESFIDSEQMAAARLERAEKADPATATTLRELRSLADPSPHR